MELLALVLEAKAQVPEEPVKVQEVDWMIEGVLMLNVWNLMLVGEPVSWNSIPIELPTIDALVIPPDAIVGDNEVTRTMAGENVAPASKD